MRSKHFRPTIAATTQSPGTPSRGPTWIDAYQKPDVVAPGSHLVSDASPKGALLRTYPNGIVKTNGKQFLKLSGTSMAAPIVSGIVAAMLEANRATHHDAPLTPNAVKAILQYTAIPLPGYDELTQGAGAVNAAGAIALAEAIDPDAPIGSNWLDTPVSPSPRSTDRPSRGDNTSSGAITWSGVTRSTTTKRRGVCTSFGATTSSGVITSYGATAPCGMATSSRGAITWSGETVSSGKPVATRFCGEGWTAPRTPIMLCGAI